jgi:hypothetical protein
MLPEKKYLLIHLVKIKFHTMNFSIEYNITMGVEDDWFDTILDRDTKLFIDPFLIFKSKNKFFVDSHKQIIDFFNDAFITAASSNNSSLDIRYRNLLSKMMFPEPEELCLGYASRSVNGAGSGKGFAKEIVNAIYDTINSGINEVTHFEELGLFSEGIGCDRISDITANILKQRFVEYTLDVCQRHNVPVKKFRLDHYEFDKIRNGWVSGNVMLPDNPYRNDQPILLVPKEFLNSLPVISSDEFWSYCWVNKNEEIRDQFSIYLKNDIDKAKIVEIAKRKRDWVDEFKKFKEQDSNVKAYDFVNDPKGIYQWDNNTLKFANSNPITIKPPQDEKEFNEIIEVIVKQFEEFVINNSGYKLLWDQDFNRAKNEEASQLLFLGIAKHYTKANNIDISREVNLGRGPVDFKFSNGYINRALLEVKLAKNSKFWNGLDAQLIKYLEVEDIKVGYFLVICYKKEDFDKVRGIEKVAEQTAKKHKVELKVFVIDATSDKPSASKL